MKLKLFANRLLLIVSAAALALFLVGCNSEPEGPAEKAGKAVDETAESAEKSMDSAADSAGDKVEEAGEAIKKTAE